MGGLDVPAWTVPPAAHRPAVKGVGWVGAHLGGAVSYGRGEVRGPGARERSCHQSWLLLQFSCSIHPVEHPKHLQRKQQGLSLPQVKGTLCDTGVQGRCHLSTGDETAQEHEEAQVSLQISIVQVRLQEVSYRKRPMCISPSPLCCFFIITQLVGFGTQDRPRPSNTLIFSLRSKIPARGVGLQQC